VIPAEEIRRVAADIGEAYHLAARGERGAGWQLILAGRRHADEAARRGEPWGADLGVLYRELADCYQETYGRPPR
jgi:hypothetical protein